LRAAEKQAVLEEIARQNNKDVEEDEVEEVKEQESPFATGVSILDEVTAVVIDNCSGYMKAGFAGTASDLSPVRV
jgi:hypothetical protein